MNRLSWFSRVKIFLGGLLFRPWIGRLIHRWHRGLIPYCGFLFRLDVGGAVPYQEVARLYFGYYEKGERNLVTRFLDPGLDVIELGGGVGITSSFVRRRMGPAQSHVCVEANPNVVKTLADNLARNFPQGTPSTILHRAIDYGAAEHTRFGVDENILGSAISGAQATAVEVPTMTLAEVHRAAGFGRFALVADIEGAEAGILEKDAAVLKQCRQIIVELHEARFEERDYSVADLDRMIRGLGFARMASRGAVFVYDAV